MKLAQRYIDCVSIYIDQKKHAEVDSVEEFLQRVDRTLIGTRLEQVVIEVGIQFEDSKSWAEMSFDRLRYLHQELASQIRSIRNSLTNDNSETSADLRSEMSRDWGMDAPTIAGITLVVMGAENASLSEHYEAHEVEYGPVAQKFWDSHFSETAFEALPEYNPWSNQQTP